MTSTSRRTMCVAVLLVFVFSILSATALAQSTVKGAIAGVITDQQGAVVPNAAVTATNIETNAEGRATADDAGRFRVVNLDPGTYKVVATSGNFTPTTREGVVVEVGRATTLDLSLGVGGKAETVEVVAEAPVINTVQQDFASNINQTSINELPINGRRWSNFALLTPAATADGNFGLISFRGISGLLNNNTVDGGDNNQAFFSEERGRTRINYSLSQAAIREFQVNTSNFSAEYGRAAGGVVNAVTKSGTNALHGSAFWYYRNNVLGATNPFSLISDPVTRLPVAFKPEDIRHQFGGTIGGALVKDRLFYFFSYDGQKRNFPGVAAPASPSFLDPITVSAPASCSPPAGTTLTPGQILACRQVTQAQSDAGLTFLRSLTGTVPRTGDQTLYLPKIDWKISNSNTLTATYNRMRWNSPAGVQTQPVVTRGIASFGDDGVKVDTGTVRLTSAITNSTINEFRFQYSRDFEFQISNPPAPGEPIGLNGRPPQVGVSTSTGITFGKANFLERKAYPDEKRWQYADSLSWSHGKHLLKIGTDINHVNDVLDNLFQEAGAYSFTTLADFLADNAGAGPSLKGRCGAPAGAAPAPGTRPCYSSYNQNFGPTRFQFATNDYNFFLQDDWRIFPRLTLNLGVRYEYEALPDPQIPNTALLPQSNTFPKDKDNFGPRIGFASDLMGDGKTSLRGGYGIYYGRIINSTISNAITNTGSATSQLNYFFTNSAAGAPIYPNVFATNPAAASKPSVVVFAPNMQNPMIHQADLVLEREIAPNTVVSASYLLSLGRDLPTFIDTNLNPPTSTITYTIVGNAPGAMLDGTSVTLPIFKGARPNTNFQAITEIRSSVHSRYDALVLQVNRRFTRGLQFQAGYTWSHATDNGQTSQTFTTTNNVVNPYDLSVENGRSNFDLRHKIGASVIWSPEWKMGSSQLLQTIVNGWTFSPIIGASSGRAYSPGISGNTPSGISTTTSGFIGSGGTGRATFLGRNVIHQPYTQNMDFRISRRIKLREQANLEFLAEAFNLFNRRNITDVSTRLYTVGGTSAAPTLVVDPLFGTPTAAGNTNFRERQVQFAIRFAF